ncbi:MAG: CCA tRNA nucleotidyltransferase [Verrucomicrobiota bacterium]
MSPTLQQNATQVVRRLQEAGHTAYFAGGCVRDQLLGVEAKDYDIATSATPDQVQETLPRVTDLQGKSFGVVRALEGEHVFEVATFRRESGYSDGRRPDAVEFTNAEEDAQRRDFTVNGLFFDPVADKLIDFVGGQKDLLEATVRAIGEPRERFAEDKLRLLRAVRFTANLHLGRSKFELAPETWSALQQMAPEICTVSIERIRDELDKIWTGPAPGRGLDLLDTSGLLAQPCVLPEIAVMHGVEQPPEFHPEGDVYEHVQLMMSQLKNAPLVLALGVLFHDVAKPTTQTFDAGSNRIRFNGHETVGADMTEQIMRRLRYPNDLIADVCTLVRYHMQFKDVLRMKISTLKRMLARPTVDEELELHRIDCLCSHGDVENYHFLINKREELEEDEIQPAKLINGHDVMQMGIPPGRQVGKILDKIYEAQLEGLIETHEEAKRMARSLASGLDEDD